MLRPHNRVSFVKGYTKRDVPVPMPSAPFTNTKEIAGMYHSGSTVQPSSLKKVKRGSSGWKIALEIGIDSWTIYISLDFIDYQ